MARSRFQPAALVSRWTELRGGTVVWAPDLSCPHRRLAAHSGAPRLHWRSSPCRDAASWHSRAESCRPAPNRPTSRWPPSICARCWWIARPMTDLRFPACAGSIPSRAGAGLLACISRIAATGAAMRCSFRRDAVVDARYAVETDACESANLYAIRSGIGCARTTDRPGAGAAVLAAASRRLPHRQRLIDRGHDLIDRKLIETLAVAVEPALAAFLLARQARQRILHQPDIAAALDRAGGGPRAIETAAPATAPKGADRSGRRARPSACRWRRRDA